MSIAILERILHDLEEVTGLTGTFLISFPEGTVLTSTMMSNLSETIIGEIFGVQETFHQFANFLEMGNLKDYILEGPNGIVLIKKIAKEDSDSYLLFLGIGQKEMNLPLLKIALIDYFKQIKANL